MNGSPIGDLAPLFIALGTILTLRKKTERRDIKVGIFCGYGVQDISEAEFIEKIRIPVNSNLHIFAYKISKRRDEDISSVAAVFFRVDENKLFNVG